MCWKLFSFDVSAAFLKGMTFEQVRLIEEEARSMTSGGSELKSSKKPERIVHLDLPRESLHLVKKLKGMETFNPAKHGLNLIK